jgi:hypothetical protein
LQPLSDAHLPSRRMHECLSPLIWENGTGMAASVGGLLIRFHEQIRAGVYYMAGKTQISSP